MPKGRSVHFTPPTRLMSLAYILLIAFIAFILTDCARRPATGAKPIRLLILLDTSGSVDLRRREQIVQFLLPAVRSVIGNATMVFCVFDVDVREIGMPSFHKIGDFLSLMQSDYLKQPAGKDTRFAPVGQRILAEEAKAEQAHQRLTAVVMTDGGFSDITELARMAGSLKALKCLDCLVIGPLTYETNRAYIHGSYYDQIKTDLADFEENRLITFPEEPQIAGAQARKLEDRLR